VDSSDPTYYSTFDERWRNVATSRSTDANPKEFFLYHAAGTGGLGGSSHIDDMVMRDRDANTAGYAAADSTKEERRFFCQDYHHNVCAVLSDGGKIIETVKYSSFGEAGRQSPKGDPGDARTTRPHTTEHEPEAHPCLWGRFAWARRRVLWGVDLASVQHA
jgi:hypothetical protein